MKEKQEFMLANREDLESEKLREIKGIVLRDKNNKKYYKIVMCVPFRQLLHLDGLNRLNTEKKITLFMLCAVVSLYLKL